MFTADHVFKVKQRVSFSSNRGRIARDLPGSQGRRSVLFCDALCGQDPVQGGWAVGDKQRHTTHLSTLHNEK